MKIRDDGLFCSATPLNANGEVELRMTLQVSGSRISRVIVPIGGIYYPSLKLEPLEKIRAITIPRGQARTIIFRRKTNEEGIIKVATNEDDYHCNRGEGARFLPVIVEPPPAQPVPRKIPDVAGEIKSSTVNRSSVNVQGIFRNGIFQEDVARGIRIEPVCFHPSGPSWSLIRSKINIEHKHGRACTLACPEVERDGILPAVFGADACTGADLVDRICFVARFSLDNDEECSVNYKISGQEQEKR
jgi:hypothetical protein